MADALPGPIRTKGKINKKWVALLVGSIGYILVALVFFKLQDWSQCLRTVTGNACNFNQMMPVVLLPIGVVGLVGVLLTEPMRNDRAKDNDAIE